MKISTKIALSFSLLTSLILVLIGIINYTLQEKRQANEFQHLLQNRIEITERFFLEKESFSYDKREKIKNEFLHTLPKETEEVVLISTDSAPIFNQNYSDALRDRLITQKTHSFSIDNVQGASKHFIKNGNKYAVIVTAIDEAGARNLHYLGNRSLLLISLAIPLVFIFSFLVTRRYLLPLSKKIKHANNISASNLNERLRVINPEDEIGMLATAFNKLLDRLEVSFEAQKSFISNASHEIRNPLTAIIGQAEVTLTKERTPEDYQEALLDILEGADSLNLTMTNLLQLSKINANEKGVLYDTLEMGDFLKSIKKSYDYQNPKNQIDINIPNIKIRVRANKNLLQTALLNLFDNACKYSKNQIVEINLNQKNDQLIIDIIDKGIGIPESDLLKIKAPFYRANNAYQFNGSGIGLALSNKIITLHKGNITIDSEENKGTHVMVSLPII